MAQANGMSSLEALIQAAQYIEENGHDEDEEAPRKRPHRYRQKKPSTYSRTTHNLLEKNRRAQLRDCLEVLRQHVPLPDKLTTLALLQSARKYIENLQQKEREETEVKLKLENDQTALLSRLIELGAGNYVNDRHSMSPPPKAPSSSASTSEICTQQTPSPKGSPCGTGKGQEEDENMVIDVLSHESEDDTSSTTSGSDGGCTSTSHKFEL